MLCVVMSVAILAGCSHQDRSTSTANSGKTLKSSFPISLGIANRDGVSFLALTPVHAGDVVSPDGMKSSVWVADSSRTGVRSRCFFIEIITPSPATSSRKPGLSAGGFPQRYIENECGDPGSEVSLFRFSSVVVGFVGSSPAATVRVLAKGMSADLPVTSGYFVIPGGLSVDPNTKFKILLFRKGWYSISIAQDLSAPGSANPSPLAIEHTISVTPKKP